MNSKYNLAIYQCSGNQCCKIIHIFVLLLFLPILSAQMGNRDFEREFPDIEFLGWNYDRLGYVLSPGEEMKLRFRNNSDTEQRFSVNWTLKTYSLDSILSNGELQLLLKPGETGGIPIDIPNDLKDGPYEIFYATDAAGWEGVHPFYFDYRKPQLNKDLNLSIVAFFENMDSEGWARTMLGPFARFVNVQKEIPTDINSVDGVLVIAEALSYFNPEYKRLEDYVRKGGKIIVFGKTAPVLFKMLPVEGSDLLPTKEKPLALKPLQGGPWQDFNPTDKQLHYPIKIRAKEDAVVLAEWSDGTPAVVKGSFGQGTVIYVGTGSYQVWQDNPSLVGSDEMALRLLYDIKGGQTLVNEMLRFAQKIYLHDQEDDLAIRDRVFENLNIQRPENFMVVSKENMGRFGWLTSEGGLTENIEGKCRITPVRTQETYQTIPDHTFDFTFSVNNENSPEPVEVKQNWFAKTITWEYPNEEQLVSTISLGSPGILWEGELRNFRINGSFTHIAFPVKGGIKIIEKGDEINGIELNENWLISINASDSIRDMPQLIVFTNRPEKIRFGAGMEFIFEEIGFSAMFSSRLYGIKRFAPGETIKWISDIPGDAVEDARKWSKAFLRYPINCEEIGWIEDNQALFADKFYYRSFNTDWKTKALEYTIIPPIYILAKNVGSPVDLPSDLIDLNCPTKYGPLKAVKGSNSVIAIELPPSDHRGLFQAEELMVLDEMINRNVKGMDLNSLTYNDQLYNQIGGRYAEDLYPYEMSYKIPYYEAPQIDLYKWWLVFNAILTRPIYTETVKEEVDRHFKTRYWETLNYYPHKSLLMRKREPWTGIEYMTTFVWPTHTRYGWRYTADVQESSAVNTYCYANYARYYGDWTTLKANWNICRDQHNFLIHAMDWAALSTGAQESWNATGIDMANSEPYGRMAFAFAAEHAGYPEDALNGKLGGVRTLITAVARLGLEPYIYSITSEGDPWREFKSFNFINEFGMQLSKRKRGGIGWLDTSKGAMHELALAYKVWAGKAMNDEQKEIAIAQGSRNSLCDLTQRLLLGWDQDSLINRVIDDQWLNVENPSRFQQAKDIYDMAFLCLGNLPVFLSEWSPAEYVSGDFEVENKIMNLEFISHLGEDFKIKIYSKFQPEKITVNNEILTSTWSYDKNTGWLEIKLTGETRKRLTLNFGDEVAPLHPYFTGIEP